MVYIKWRNIKEKSPLHFSMRYTAISCVILFVFTVLRCFFVPFYIRQFVFVRSFHFHSIYFNLYLSKLKKKKIISNYIFNEDILWASFALFNIWHTIHLMTHDFWKGEKAKKNNHFWFEPEWNECRTKAFAPYQSVCLLNSMN